MDIEPTKTSLRALRYPTGYDPAIHPLLVRWAAREGVKLREVARRLNVKYSIFIRWLSDFPEFRTALQAGQNVADTQVINGLHRRAVGYHVENTEIVEDGPIRRIKKSRRHLPPDVRAAIFWLKNRTPDWRDRPLPPRPVEIIARVRPVKPEKTTEIKIE